MTDALSDPQSVTIGLKLKKAPKSLFLFHSEIQYDNIMRVTSCGGTSKSSVLIP